MRPFVVGTAGHIDHGKSALVKALTGIDPDRLPEEKKRGITIELGFSHGDVAPGLHAAFVDVPGHERFVRAMVAGAHGVDVVLLVVALDEGVMPQTREHADICRLLRVPRAIVALTKSDLAPQLDPEWPALVADDVRSLGEPFASAPQVRVSARTGEGLDALRAKLADAARALPTRPTAVPPFLPIDRAFTLKGHGTVVTGTLLAGSLELGQAVELVGPAPREVRVTEGLRARTLHTHGRAVERAQAGQRVAVNLPGLEVAEVERGSALVGEGSGRVRAGAILDCEVELVPGAPPLKNRGRVSIHLGTAQALAVVDLLGRAELAAGESTVAQLRLDRAIPALRDQRFVLRGFRALARGGHTIAGGRVLLVAARRRRAADRARVEALVADAKEAARALVLEAGPAGVDVSRLSLLVGERIEKQLPGTLRLGQRLFDLAALTELARRLRENVRARPGVPREEARAALGHHVDPDAFAHAVANLGPEFTAGETLGLAQKKADPLAELVASRLASCGLTPPTAGELATELGRDRTSIGGALRALAKDGRAVRLTDELFADAGAANEFRRRATDALRQKGELTTLELKEIAGTSRKFAIPLCEWLDREHVTLRVGEKRTLRGRGGA